MPFQTRIPPWSGKETRPGRRKDHRPRMIQPKQHDTYASRKEVAKALVCDRCEVVFHAGRWYWGAPPLTDVRDGLCPACERIRDRYPAGTLRLPEVFLAQRDEVLGLIKNAEKAEKAEHPLERLMDIEDGPDGGLIVTTTGIHLARAIANKLERRFHRQARIRYPEEQKLIQVDWEE